ncbi:GIN domain-containing protein [Fibrella aquatilis]|uniref:DUF2807 domain-containing protein n=1 Tax=Fibrella aquatilis TaxID=2817059 RepID=A0A939G5L0_9BACT|nr:DUF2807 domain-containing protein [Fibrella aquatilis]MBO0930840.1 DUF2807 domain-containing protein [Fibrella aquatilis]
MKTILLTIALLSSATLYAQRAKYDSSQELRGSGRLIRETKSVVSFTRIQTQQFPANTTVEVGGDESSVDISLDDNLRPFLQIDEQNGVLKLSFAEPSGKPFWISKSTISVTIRTPRLIGFKHGSNSNVDINGLNGERFDLANQANGNVTLRGKVTTLNVVSAANGDVQADDLIAQTANVVSTANANLRINAQTVNEVNSGNGQVINVAKRAK